MLLIESQFCKMLGLSIPAEFTILFCFSLTSRSEMWWGGSWTPCKMTCLYPAPRPAPALLPLLLLLLALLPPAVPVRCYTDLKKTKVGKVSGSCCLAAYWPVLLNFVRRSFHCKALSSAEKYANPYKVICLGLKKGFRKRCSLDCAATSKLFWFNSPERWYS